MVTELLRITIRSCQKVDTSQTPSFDNLKSLSGKYVQYQEIGIGDYVIMIVPQKVITWKNV